MNKETQIEVIKALAFGMPVVDIANFAGTTEEEIEAFARDNKKAIEERKNAAEEYGL